MGRSLRPGHRLCARSRSLSGRLSEGRAAQMVSALVEWACCLLGRRILAPADQCAVADSPVVWLGVAARHMVETVVVNIQNPAEPDRLTPGPGRRAKISKHRGPWELAIMLCVWSHGGWKDGKSNPGRRLVVRLSLHHFGADGVSPGLCPDTLHRLHACSAQTQRTRRL